ncbi:unnamed protein product, partial [Mesorhabditis spiculigera]
MGRFVKYWLIPRTTTIGRMEPDSTQPLLSREKDKYLASFQCEYTNYKNSEVDFAILRSPVSRYMEDRHNVARDSGMQKGDRRWFWCYLDHSSTKHGLVDWVIFEPDTTPRTERPELPAPAFPAVEPNWGGFGYENAGPQASYEEFPLDQQYPDNREPIDSMRANSRTPHGEMSPGNRHDFDDPKNFGHQASYEEELRQGAFQRNGGGINYPGGSNHSGHDQYHNRLDDGFAEPGPPRNPGQPAAHFQQADQLTAIVRQLFRYGEVRDVARRVDPTLYSDLMEALAFAS